MTKKKRHCRICGTTLNIYNHGPYCHAHTPGELVYKIVPITKCAGRPGDGYQAEDLAVDGFERILIGVIDEDHNLVPLFEEEEEEEDECD